MMSTAIESFFSWKTWSCDGISNGPSLFESLRYAPPNDADSRAPFGFAKLFAIKRNKNIGSAICTLLANCLPTAIVGRVWTVVIDSTKTMFGRRSRTHVLVEVLKRRQPSFTNDYASLSIAPIARASFVQTSRLHGSPDVKLWGFRESVRESRLHCDAKMTVLSHLFSALFDMQTPARPGVTVSKVRNDTGFMSAAVALTQKLSLFRGCPLWKNRKHSHSTVAVPDQFVVWNSNCHNVAFINTKKIVSKTFKEISKCM